jgi:hypothetical protein
MSLTGKTCSGWCQSSLTGREMSANSFQGRKATDFQLSRVFE